MVIGDGVDCRSDHKEGRSRFDIAHGHLQRQGLDTVLCHHAARNRATGHLVTEHMAEPGSATE